MSEKVIFKNIQNVQGDFFHRAIVQERQKNRQGCNNCENTLIFLYLYLDSVSSNLPAPALIILFDIFRERVNQIEYNQWEESAPARLVSTWNGRYTRDSPRAPAYSRR